MSGWVLIVRRREVEAIALTKKRPSNSKPATRRLRHPVGGRRVGFLWGVDLAEVPPLRRPRTKGRCAGGGLGVIFGTELVAGLVLGGHR